MTAINSFIESLKSKLPYYTIPCIKIGLVGGALICILEAKLRTVIFTLFSLILSPDTNILILYYYVYYYTTLSLHFLFFAGAIFYGIKGAKKIMPTASFNFKHAFIVGFTTALVALGVFEFNTLLYAITGSQSFSFFKNLLTILTYIATGVIISLILSAVFKSKPVSEAINTPEQNTSSE